MTIRDTFDFAMGAVAQALGEPATYTRDGEDPVAVQAVIGSGFQSVQSGAVRIASSRPEVMVQLSAFSFSMAAADVRGDTIEFLGSTYTVESIRPDIEGVGATLVLKASS